MNKREQRKQQAQDHLAYIKEAHHEDILRAIQGSIIVDDNNVHPAQRAEGFGDSHIIIDSLTTTQALFKYKTAGSIALLNFASYKHPGGGFLNGSLAQEEALCAGSTLYPVLSSFEAFYTANRKRPNDGLYDNRGIFSPGICFLNDEEDIYADVISVAAPNRSHNIENVSDEQNRAALASRCEFIYNVAAQYSNATILILGAFGCGVFKQNPENVATIFKQIVTSINAFDIVVFAIPKDKNRNCEIFNKVMNCG